MAPVDQHKAEDQLRDLMALGEIAADIHEEREKAGHTATVPAAWFGVLGRLTKEVSDLKGDLPDLEGGGD